MTGYGHCALHTPDFHVTAEFKTVNHKFLELTLKLPQNYLEQEIHLRNEIAQRVKRGKGFLMVTVQHLNPNKGGGKATLNESVLLGYYHDLRHAALQAGLTPDIKLTDLLALPNVFTDTATAAAEEEWALVQQAVKTATDKLLENRRREGQNLEPEFRQCVATLRECVQGIEPFEKARIETIRARMENALAELGKNITITEDRFQQELFYYVEKLDIAEEKARIAVHLDAFLKTLDEPESNARKLTFLTQELWREVNTLGNKAYNSDMQTLVVRMKEELEKIKEQMNNIV
jgi:uncharacterized protein (TIGR00255 family)